MSPLVKAFPQLQKAVSLLSTDDQWNIEFDFAQLLPADHPNKAEYRQKVIAYLEANPHDRLHKIFKDFIIDFETAARLSRRLQDPATKLRCFYWLSKQNPDKFDECAQEIATAIQEGGHLYMRTFRKEEIAKEFGMGVFGTCYYGNAIRIQYHLTQAGKRIETDPAKALTHFKTALGIFREPPTKDIEDLRRLEKVFKSRAEAINEEWQRAFCTAPEHILQAIEEKTNCFRSEYQAILSRNGPGADERKAVKAVVLQAVDKGHAEFLLPYLEFLDCQFFAVQQEDARDLMQKLTVPQVTELANSHTRWNMVTVQLALKIGDVKRANAIRRKLTLDKTEKAFFLAQYATVVMRLDEFNKHFIVWNLKALKLKGVALDNFILAKCKLASILYPFFPKEALDLFLGLFPQVEGNDLDFIRLKLLLKKYKNFEAAKEVIAQKISTLYLSQIESFGEYKLSLLADELLPYFPHEAKQFYEAALRKDPTCMRYALAVAKLSGEEGERIILAHLDQFIANQNRNYVTFLRIFEAIAQMNCSILPSN